jgi:DDE family transposase
VNAEADQSPNVLRICTDAKATVKIGELCRGGMSWVVIKSLDHDFQPDAILTPIDILLPEHDELHLYFVLGSATADAYADVLEHFWKVNGHRFPGVDTFVLNQDNGPEVHSRRTQFMARLVELADATHMTLRLAYYPPYHSKYNPAERPWAVLENEWNGDLLDTIAAAVGHARSMTWKGEHPTVIEWFDKTYEKGKKLGNKAMSELEKRFERLPGLPKWFVDIAPASA